MGGGNIAVVGTKKAMPVYGRSVLELARLCLNGRAVVGTLSHRTRVLTRLLDARSRPSVLCDATQATKQSTPGV